MLVVAYLAVFPFDIFSSRAHSSRHPRIPSLYAALLGAVHFLLFVMLVRLYSATTDRDAFFPGDAGLRRDSGGRDPHRRHSFLVLFFIFLLFGVATFVGMEMRRGGKGAIAQPLRSPRRNGTDARADVCGAERGGGRDRHWRRAVLLFSAIQRGLLGRTSMQPSLMTGFTDDVELGQIGEIKKNPTVVMRVKTGKPVGYPQLRWRGIALSTFDGKRWSTPNHRRRRAAPDATGWIYVADPEQKRRVRRSNCTTRFWCSRWPRTRCSRRPTRFRCREDFSGENPNAGCNLAAHLSCSAISRARFSIRSATTRRCATTDTRGFRP